MSVASACVVWTSTAGAIDVRHDLATIRLSLTSWCGTHQYLQVQSGIGSETLQPGQDTDGGFWTSMMGRDRAGECRTCLL